MNRNSIFFLAAIAVAAACLWCCMVGCATPGEPHECDADAFQEAMGTHGESEWDLDGDGYVGATDWGLFLKKCQGD